MKRFLEDVEGEYTFCCDLKMSVVFFFGFSDVSPLFSDVSPLFLGWDRELRFQNEERLEGGKGASDDLLLEI